MKLIHHSVLSFKLNMQYLVYAWILIINTLILNIAGRYHRLYDVAKNSQEPLDELGYSGPELEEEILDEKELPILIKGVLLKLKVVLGRLTVGKI